MTFGLTLIGVLMMVAGPVMVWIGRAHSDGQVRSFLKSEFVQTLYTLASIVVTAIGAALVLSSIGRLG